MIPSHLECRTSTLIKRRYAPCEREQQAGDRALVWVHPDDER